MPRVTMTIARFNSFEEISKALERWHWEGSIPENSEHPGIHIVTVYDDIGIVTTQHVCVVVIGNVESKWEIINTFHGRSVRGSDSEIITVTFEQGKIPVLMDGKELELEVGVSPIETHSIYSPPCRCIRIKE